MVKSRKGKSPELEYKVDSESNVTVVENDTFSFGQLEVGDKYISIDKKIGYIPRRVPIYQKIKIVIDPKCNTMGYKRYLNSVRHSDGRLFQFDDDTQVFKIE